MIEAITPDLLRSLPLPEHDGDADKEERGRALVIGGSRPVPGALMLAGVAALRAGAGKLQLATVESIATQIGIAVPEALVMALPETADGNIDPSAVAVLGTRAGRCDAVLIGPGMLDEDNAALLTGALLKQTQGPAFVLDAGAVCHMSSLSEAVRKHEGQVVLTPHAGETAKLTGLSREAVMADPQGVALNAARKLGVVIALKGGSTIVAAPDGRSWIYRDGHVGLATSGSGDTLAGIITGLLARGAPPHEAAIWGVFLHGEAGNRLSRQRGPIGFLARELLAEVPLVMAALQKRQDRDS